MPAVNEVARLRAVPIVVLDEFRVAEREVTETVCTHDHGLARPLEFLFWSNRVARIFARVIELSIHFNPY